MQVDMPNTAHKKFALCTICMALNVIVMMTITPVAAWSQEIPEAHTKAVTLYWENDSFTGTDRDYTNGLKLTWSRPYTPPSDEKHDLTDWMMDHLPFMDEPDAVRGTSFSIGQNMFTPEDTTRSDIIDEDRPYAGFSYLGFGFVSNNGRRRDVWEIDVGIVGPLSHGQTTQDWVHDVIGADKAKGWNNQLENELGLEFICESKWQMWRIENQHGFGMDIIPHVGGRFGNIAIYASTGAEFRFGWLVPKDFGTCPIRPGCDAGSALNNVLGLPDDKVSNKIGIHFFSAFEARAVLKDIFLDGNTSQESHSVDKKLLVADLMGGVAVHYGRFQMNYSFIYRTQEFDQQNDDHTFGAVSITYLY